VFSAKLFHRGFGSLGDMSSFVRRFHRGFGSLGDMSSFVGRFHGGAVKRKTKMGDGRRDLILARTHPQKQN
jgi:hypothetical protein